MSFATLAAAKSSLREFSPSVRQLHTIIRFWSDTHQAYRFSRVYA